MKIESKEVIKLDQIDKAILARLLGNSRVSYRQLARDLSVTCPTIKKRVDKLVDTGVIEGFTLELSHETLGVSWVYSEVMTDLSENRASLVEALGNHPAVREVYIVGSREYHVLAELPIPDGLYEFGKFLRSQEGVQSARVIPVRQLSSRCVGGFSRYTSRGRNVEFTNSELKILESLENDSRLSLLEISNNTGFSAKRIRRIIRGLKQEEGVSFTIQFNPATNGGISFILQLKFDENIASPDEVAQCLSQEFSEHIWFSLLCVDKPCLVSLLTAENLSEVEQIIRDVKVLPFRIDVDAKVIYQINKFRRYLSSPEREKSTSSSTVHDIISQEIITG